MNNKIAETDKSGLVEIPQTQEAAVMGMLQTALEKGVDADSLEKLLNMQERILDRTAEQAYTIAMVKVQGVSKRITEDAENTQTRSNYATLESINKVLVPAYTKEGFSLSFGTDDSPLENHVRVTCDVMHSGGHSKPYHCDMPLDIAGIAGKVNKTKIHGTGSALKYGRRYLTCMIFNISTGDKDDDGNAAGFDVITDDQATVLYDLISETKSDKAQFLKYCKVTSLDQLPASKFEEAKRALEAKK